MVDTDDVVTDVDGRQANSDELRSEQADDPTLKQAWKFANENKCGYFVKDGILFHHDMILGQRFDQICLPENRRSQVLMLGHSIAGGHLGSKKTRERIRLSFYWPTLTSDVQKYVQTCKECQGKARVTYRDRVPISAIPRNERPFSHWFMDCLGPLFPGKAEYNYALVLVDSATRWPAAYALRSLNAKNVCDAIIQLWQFTGCGDIVSSDCGSNFTSQLTREFMKRLGCSPRFTTPGHPKANGLSERMVGTSKSIVSKLAADHPRS